eukprot:3953712-Prymnesium_polylepis.1
MGLGLSCGVDSGKRVVAVPGAVGQPLIGQLQVARLWRNPLHLRCRRRARRVVRLLVLGRADLVVGHVDRKWLLLLLEL